MVEHFAIYDVETGEYLWRGSGVAGSYAKQPLEAGQAACIIPSTAVALHGSIQLDRVKDMYMARVDEQAGSLRRRFITEIPGQQTTYLNKEQEALAWAPELDQDEFPYLLAEVEETEQPIADLVSEIISTSQQWRTIDPQIEGKRRGAKVRIAAATTLGAVVLAAEVDWQEILA